MLSRVANSIYWMTRYIERAENLARFIDVSSNVILDQPEAAAKQWEPLVRTTSDEKYFREHYGEFTASNVRNFLTFDREYSNSILSSLSQARENARTVREAISSEAWEVLNENYLAVKHAALQGAAAANSDFYTEVKRQSHLFNGVFDSTMSRDKGWYFANIGRFLERADKTSRILDVKYFTLLPSFDDVDTTLDDLLWSAVLRSVSGFEMYRKRYHSLTINRVVEFLVLDTKFPRSIHYCVRTAIGSLNRVGGPEDNIALKQAAAIEAKLCNVTAKEVINGGLHEFIDGIQKELNRLGEAIHETYFARRDELHATPVKLLSATQSQSQSLTN
ncbi:alpha-E domain-containing protein [Aureliella helgolandensis]|uniref:DUF403 domain-containing protein n=1 Tax=Aureliella helgolandensis TaxID=2527968 RepID=A0A518G0I7_9BACT|nr:alpha-E domain-containing protein [Aureliella helgolandensis]QDV22119.1 hypothetical protein Q31a_04020 [Aureliella helgolandensis]